MSIHEDCGYAETDHADFQINGKCVINLPDELPTCPVCSGVVELTPSGYLTCREHGSEHYRVEAPN